MTRADHVDKRKCVMKMETYTIRSKYNPSHIYIACLLLLLVSQKPTVARRFIWISVVKEHIEDQILPLYDNHITHQPTWCRLQHSNLVMQEKPDDISLFSTVQMLTECFTNQSSSFNLWHDCHKRMSSYY